MTMFTARAYNHFEVDDLNGIVKKSSTEKRLYDEGVYYTHLPNDIKPLFARFFGYKKIDNKHQLSLEYYAYENLGKILLNSSDEKMWSIICDTIIGILSKFKTLNKSYYDINDIKEMTLVKTTREYENLLQNKFFGNLSKYHNLFINGKEYKNFEELQTKLEEYFYNIHHNPFTFIHGDLCFSNILCGISNDKAVLRLIDPRGSFGKELNYGDTYYDLAKLMHSVNGGYEYFINDAFEIDVKENTLRLNYHNDNKKIVHKILSDKLFDKYDMDKIKLYEGLIYVGMCARHYDSLERQIAMYFTGVKLLNEVLFK